MTQTNRSRLEHAAAAFALVVVAMVTAATAPQVMAQGDAGIVEWPYVGADQAHREGTPVNVNLYYFDLLNHHL